MGYQGYFFFPDPEAQITDQGVTTHWDSVAQLVTLHPFFPYQR
ncbi:MAG TPA: hypothetical protein VMT34_18790 [Aggregatilineales bacterium]|nr:hypothetical protein [Aggregatilineales bacterium]